MRGLVISAPSTGQGKTTVTIGLMAALRARGLAVAAAKSGPDYIDPAFHAAACGGASITLDPWAAGPVQLRARAAGASGDLLVVEGAMGLHDGADDGTAIGAGSTADLAVALGLPLVVVVDAAGLGQGVGAVLKGLADWRPEVSLAGAILNRVGSPRHEAMLRRTTAEVCPVLGVLPRAEEITVPSRHLGLVQAGEVGAEALVARAAAWVRAGVDLDAILAVAKPVAIPEAPPTRLPPLGQRIAVAQDTAFGFAYRHMLEDWRVQGAEVLPFSPLADQPPDPMADAVMLPGGYPELHASALASAARFREGMIRAADRGALIYGECGGYMVLGRGLMDAEGHAHQMLGLLDLETSFAERRRHLGYRQLETTSGPWAGRTFRGHEFHYATTISAHGTPLFRAKDAAGTDLGSTGLVAGKVMGSFAHIIEVG